jgi:hypothetical protein
MSFWDTFLGGDSSSSSSDSWDPTELRNEGFGNEDFSPGFWDTLYNLGGTAVKGLAGLFKKNDGSVDWGKVGSLAGGVSGLLGLNDPRIQKVGYQGKIPDYTAVRAPVQNTYDPNRRPGSGGQRYFSDLQYVDPSKADETRAAAITAAQGLAAQNLANPARQTLPPPPPVVENANKQEPAAQGQPASSVINNLPVPHYATGGIANLAQGRYLGGSTDGMADKLPASIDGKEKAALSHGEFVIPADVVSHLGNGNSDAGAKQLYAMMDRIRQARTGNKKQGKQINPQKYLPT